jgi:hypothetical protein
MTWQGNDGPPSVVGRTLVGQGCAAGCAPDQGHGQRTQERPSSPTAHPHQIALMVGANAPRGSARMTGMVAVLAPQMLKYAPAESLPVRLEHELAERVTGAPPWTTPPHRTSSARLSAATSKSSRAPRAADHQRAALARNAATM